MENPTSTPAAYLEVRDLHKSYPDGWTLAAVDFTVRRGENLCLLGPSGCGKTTLLRLIAGLETPDGGQILLEGRDVTRVPPHQRGFGLMFQEYALFPHKNVFENIAFGLRTQGLKRDALAARVAEVLELVGLKGFEHRDVNQLSGGERQRVALARSLAPRPQLLMLDEPLGALDRAMRERLMEELPDILQRAGVTTITVTHDQEEAFAIADRVALMRDGRIVQIGTPQEVYCHPTSMWVARFLGLTNLLEGHMSGPYQVTTPLGTLHVSDQQHSAPVGTPVRVLIRPEAAALDSHNSNSIQGTIIERSFRGSHYRVVIHHKSGTKIALHFPPIAPLPPVGNEVTLALNPQALTLLPEDPVGEVTNPESA